jgi:hypothetical protein
MLGSFHINHAEIDVMHERRRLQRLPGLFVSEFGRRQTP